jgi:hypothetical protein
MANLYGGQGYSNASGDWAVRDYISRGATPSKIVLGKCHWFRRRGGTDQFIDNALQVCRFMVVVLRIQQVYINLTTE